MKKIAIIIPAYNETENLKNLVTKINQNLNNCEIYIVDDSKTNESEKTLEQFKNINYIFRGKKLGRGSAVLLGIAKCIEKKFDIYIEMDADFSHNPDELEEKIKKFIQSKADILIASRYLKESKIINWNLSRRIFSKLSNFLARRLLKIPISDYTNGFRIYSHQAANLISNKCGKIGDGFIVLSEILVVLFNNSLNIVEDSTIFVNRKRGESSVNLKLIIQSFLGLIKLYFLKNKKHGI